MHRNGRETVPASGAEAVFTVAYFDAEGPQTRILQSGVTYTIGRADSCDIVIKHSTISRSHAILVGGSPPAIKDQGSRNGTRVGGVPVPPNTFARIDVGTVVQLGEVVLFIQRVQSELPSKPPPGTEEATRSPDREITPKNSAVNVDDLVVEDPRSREFFNMARVIAASDLTVLILGETGSGKERLAQTIHTASSRASRPLVSLNCAAFPETMVESELFGYERGAFTGAARAKPGLIVAASGGTLFLDEVGELTLPIQAKLLRALETREVLPLGALKAIAVDIRIIAATNRSLRDHVASGRFREDLYYRLNGVTLEVPSLRERRGDILPLAMMFARRFAQRLGRPTPVLSDEAREAVVSYNWPGNIRELKNVMERATLLATSGVIEAGAIPSTFSESVANVSFNLVEEPPTLSSLVAAKDASSAGVPGKRRILAREEIVLALEQTGGDQEAAARVLGVSRRTLINWLDKLQLPRPRKRPG